MSKRLGIREDCVGCGYPFSVNEPLLTLASDKVLCFRCGEGVRLELARRASDRPASGSAEAPATDTRVKELTVRSVALEGKIELLQEGIKAWGQVTRSIEERVIRLEKLNGAIAYEVERWMRENT